MKSIAVTLFSLFLFLPIYNYAQTPLNDCSGAEVVCSDEDLAFNPQGPGQDDFANPNNDPGCMTALEQNSAWYYFEIDPNAPPALILGFIISPNGGLGEDYDWALYGPDVECGNLGSPIRCSSSSAACDFCPETGMGMGTMDTSEGPGTGDGFVMTLQVEPGQGFYLLIDNWLGTTNGFVLTWTDTAAEWLNCDAEPPCALSAIAGDDISACEGDVLSLNGESAGNDGNETYSWSGTNGGTGYLDNPNSEDPTVTLPIGFNGTIIYTLTVTEDGCENDDEMELTVNPLPIVNINQIGPFCQEDDTETLSATPGGGVWGGAANGNVFDPMANGPGIHTVTYSYTDGNNCTAMESIDIEVYTNPEVTIAPDPAEFCQSEGSILLTATGNGGAGGFTYVWDTPTEMTTGDTYNATFAGNYTVEVTDANGCTNSSATTVTINPNPIVQIVNPGPICENVDFMTLTAVPAGGTFEGTIISPTGDLYPNTIPPGTYSISYTYFDINNCEGNDNIDITIFTTPNAFPDNNGPLCEGQQILLFGETDGEGSNVSYLWTGPNGYTSNVQNPTNATQGGVYVMQVIIDGCASEFEFTDVVITEMPIAFALNDGPYCAGQSIQLLGSSNINGNVITYEWSGPNGYISTQQNPTDATDDGIYSLIVTVDNCPSEVATTEVLFSAPPDAEASNDGPYCEGDAIQLNGNTNTLGNVITYTWNGPNGYESFDQNPIDALEAGLYELVVDVDGCISAIETTDVLVNANPQPVITGQDAFCTGNSATIDAGGGYAEYLWDDASTNQLLEVFSSGIFGVTVTDGNGCIGENSFEVTENSSLSPVITGTLDFCEGSNTILDAGANYSSYEWSNSELTQTIEVSTGGNYGVIVTDDDGCTGSANVTTTVNSNPIITIGGSTSYCIGGYTILDAGDGFDNYNWSNDSTSQTITVSSPGDYSVDVIDSNGCTGSASATIEESTSLNPVITGNNAFCENGSTTLNAGSGFDTYIWSEGTTTQTLFVDVAGNYAVTVSDVQGCTGENTISISEVLPPSAELQSDAELCNTEAGGSIINLFDLIISGDTGGSWEDADNSGAVGLFNNLNFNNIPAGDYNFIYTTNSAVNPCPETEYQVLVTVIDCTCPDVFFFNADPLCNEGDVLDLTTIENTLEDGIWTIIQTPAGANPASLNGTFFDATASDPGEYILQFDLQNQPPPGCPISFQAIVNVDPTISAGAATQSLSYCFNENEMVTLIDLITGADANGTWTETSVTPSQGLAFDPFNGTFSTNSQNPGNYTFEYTVSSPGVCPDDATEVSVVINQLPDAVVADFVVLNCQNPVQSLDASGSSFGLDYEITWTGPGILLDGNENSLNPNINEPGNYQLTVTNTLTGCTAQASTQVTSDTDLPQASAGNDDSITCNDPAVTLQAGGDVGIGFEIEWSGPAINAGNMNDANPQIDIPGMYILSITDLSNSCVSNADTVIILNETASPDIFIQFPSSELDCNNSSISLTGGSADPNVSFEWFDPNSVIIGNAEIANNIDVQGIYTLIVTNDLTGCTASETVEVMDNTEFPTVNIATPTLLDCINTNSILDGTGSSSGPEIEYLWSGPTGGINGVDDEITADAILPGTYTLVVSNISNGCSSSAQVTIQQDIDLPNVQIVMPEELDCSTLEVTLDGTGSTSGSGISYSWLDDSGTEISTSISFETENPGVYELTVLNVNNGCTNSSSIVVIENTDIPTDALLVIEDPSCFGDQNAFINIEQVIGGTAPYLFSLNNEPFSNNNFYNNLAAGSYEIALEDANGCRWDTLILIQEPLPIELNLGPDIELELGENATVQAQVNLPLNQIDTLIWSPDDLIICVDSLCMEGIVQTFNTISLNATIIDENGCRASDEVTIVMQKDRRVFIPTAFSPNGDGTNDKFQIFVDQSQIVKINEFRIFNRWGEVVYEAEDFTPDDPVNGWDGNFKNERMNPGVFVYFAEIEFIDGLVEIYKGDVTLMK